MKIINLSLITGICPELCKTAKVVPIHTNGNPLDYKNYRPITILPVFSKIFEKVTYSRMYKFREENKFIYNKH